MNGAAPEMPEFDDDAIDALGDELTGIRRATAPAANDSPTAAGSSSKRPVTPAETLDRMQTSGPVVHVSTGLGNVDDMTAGGPRLGDLVAILGSPDAGKTALVAQLVDVLAEAGVLVGVVMVDEDDEGFVTRLAQRRNWSRGEVEQRSEFADLASRMPANILIYDADWSIEEVIAELAGRVEPGKRVALFVDSAQTMRIGGSDDTRSPAERISLGIRVLKHAALARRWLVVFTSEMGRGSYSGVGERTSALAAAKWSGDIEYAAKLLLALRSVDGDSDLLEVEIAKNKVGGKTGKVYLRIDRSHQRLTEAPAPDQPEDDARDRATTAKARRDAKRVLNVVASHPGIGARELRAQTGLGAQALDRALVELGARIENRPEQRGAREFPHYYAVPQTATEAS